MTSQEEQTPNTLILKCHIKTDKLEQDQFTVQNSTNDPHKLLSTIKSKFKCLEELDDNAWTICINSQIIDKNNENKFRSILSSISSPATVDIVYPTNSGYELKNKRKTSFYEKLFKWKRIKHFIQYIINFSALCAIIILLLGLSMRHFIVTDNDQMISILKSTHDEIKLRFSDSINKPTENLIEFAHIHKFSDMIMGQFDTLDDAKQAIKNSAAVPPEVSRFLTGSMTDGDYYMHSSDSCDFTASQGGQYSQDESGNGGGYKFKHSLVLQRTDTEKYQIIFAIAGRRFEIADQVEWKEVPVSKTIKVAKKGYFGTYYEEKVVREKEMRKFVTPRNIEEKQMDSLVESDFVNYMYSVAIGKIEVEIKRRLTHY